MFTRFVIGQDRTTTKSFDSYVGSILLFRVQMITF